jgi:predicted transcriptional regulator
MLLRQVRKNPRKRRDKLEIVAEILKAARDGARKTRIMYRVGLGTVQLASYLSFLIGSGLLETSKKNEKLIYKTTAKGNRYVMEHEEIKHLLRKSTEKWKVQ